jgi:D-inositol-3-phosphate glycosyltransferase
MHGRIAIISDHASPIAAATSVHADGQHVHVAHTACALAARGHEVDVFTRRDDPTLPPVVQWHPGVRVVHIEAGPPHFMRKEDLLPTMSTFAERIVDIAQRARSRGEGYALAHAHFFMSGLVARRLREEIDLPYVVTFHALGRVRATQRHDDDFPPERGTLEQMVIDSADAIVAECPQNVLDLRRYYDVDPTRIAMIPCGFAPQEFVPIERAEARAKLSLPQDRPILLVVGRIVARKGIDNLIRAVAIARRDHGVDPLLVVVGGNSDTPDPVMTQEVSRLEQIANDEHVGDALRFVGHRTRAELRDYYCAADVFVTTPWYEPFGMGVVEAMACGVPVIGARVGGIQHTVQHGRTGFLVEPKNPLELARRIVQLLSDAGMRQVFGERGRRRAYQQFPWSRIAKQLDALYAQITRRHSAEARVTALAAARHPG